MCPAKFRTSTISRPCWALINRKGQVGSMTQIRTKIRPSTWVITTKTITTQLLARYSLCCRNSTPHPSILIISPCPTKKAPRRQPQAQPRIKSQPRNWTKTCSWSLTITHFDHTDTIKMPISVLLVYKETNQARQLPVRILISDRQRKRPWKIMRRVSLSRIIRGQTRLRQREHLWCYRRDVRVEMWNPKRDRLQSNPVMKR